MEAAAGTVYRFTKIDDSGSRWMLYSGAEPVSAQFGSFGFVVESRGEPSKVGCTAQLFSSHCNPRVYSFPPTHPEADSQHPSCLPRFGQGYCDMLKHG
jgi:hypothetical protein